MVQAVVLRSWVCSDMFLWVCSDIYPLDLSQSSQATVLERWPSRFTRQLPGRGETPLDYLHTPTNPNKSATGRPGLFQSFQVSVLELWVSLHLSMVHLPPASSLRHLEITRGHRKRRDLARTCLNLELVVQASPRALRPPFWSTGLALPS